MRTITARVATKFLKKASQDLEIHIYDFDETLFRVLTLPSGGVEKDTGNGTPISPL